MGAGGFGAFGLALFAVNVVFVFWGTLSKYGALVAPDSMPFFAYAYRTLTFEGLLGGQSFTPHTLYWLLLNPLYAHELTYILDTLVLTLGGVYYLRGRRAHPLAAWAGGLALGFSGYTFTLFCAGHRGYFHMFSCAVWAFGLIARGFETRRLIYFALFGLVLAWGIPYQPDVLLLVGGLAAAYVLWLTFRTGAAQGERAGVWRQMVAVWPRFLVSVAVIVLAGWGGIRWAVTSQFEGREKHFDRAMGREGSQAGAVAEQTEAEKLERWIFATSWSMPPEDVIEFLVPGVFGNESMQGDYPYWGRLGRPHESVFQKGRVMPNYRQHTVYVGVVTLLFAFLAVVAHVAGRKAGGRQAGEGGGADRGDIPFWCAMAVFCLFLAMGRYTPVYRLFYAIPYMGYIRAPVKFVHLAEVAFAFLAGFGMDAFLRQEGAAIRRRFAWAASGLILVLAVGGLVAVVAKPMTLRHIAELGMGPLAERLAGYTLRNVMRAVFVVSGVAGVAWFAVRRGMRGGVVAGCGMALLALLVLDQGVVARRYVRVIDVRPLYTENAVVKAIKKHAGGETANVVSYATPNMFGQDWFSTALTMNGVRNLMPGSDEMEQPYGRLFAGMQQEPVRLWQVLNAQFVIAPRKGLDGLLRAGILRRVMDFELGAGVVRQVETAGEKTLTLAAVAGQKAGARALTAWGGGVATDAQTQSAGRTAGVVSEAPSPAAPSAAVREPTLTTLSVAGHPGKVATRLLVEGDAQTLVVFNERHLPTHEVLVDGVPVPCYLTDGVWASSVVPAGRHEVVLRKKRDVYPAAGSFVTTLAVLLFAVWAFRERGAVATAA